MPITQQLHFFLIYFPVVLISVAIHEFAHCWTTDRLGDDTPRQLGRVTLNPLKHLDPIGTLMMVVAAFAGVGIGWGRAAVFNPLNFRHPARDRMLSALAGPVSNLLQMLAWGSIGALLSVLPAGWIPMAYLEFANSISYAGILVNAVLAMFNLLPIYPLDGHHILSFITPPQYRHLVDHPAGMYIFLALVFIPGLRDAVLAPFLGVVHQLAPVVTTFLTGWPL